MRKWKQWNSNFFGLFLLLLVAAPENSLGFELSSRRASPRVHQSTSANLLCRVSSRPQDDELQNRASFPFRFDQNESSRREFGTSISNAMTTGMMAVSLFAERASAAQVGPVTVIGANGRTGYECVKALQARGILARACTRQGVYRDGNNLKGVESMKCDVTDASTIEQVVNGASSVIFAASASKDGGTPAAVDNAGLVAVAKACIDAKVKQLVIVSSGAVSKPSSPVYIFLNAFGSIMSEKIQGEDTVRALYAVGTPAAEQGLSYTIVRPGGLTEEPSLGSVEKLELNQGDTKSGRISRADVANICVEALAYPELTGRTTLECYNADTGAPLGSVGISNIFKQTTNKDSFVSGRECRGNTWKELFSGLEKD
jgi:nucleoside-diphosphate-sugar epimerase